MKKLSFLILSAALILAATALVAQSTAQKYTCVMHPKILADQPGKCPKCGMTLVAVEADKKRFSAKTATAAEHPTPKAFPSQAPNEKHDHASHDRHEMHDMRPMSMPSSVNVAEPMSRES